MCAAGHFPFVEITEQPQQRGFRFRYECEGPSHGGLQGEKTERTRKTHPSIRVNNYEGPASIQVSLVTDESPHKPHAHKLVGKNCADGVCKLNVESTAGSISFPNLCVLHVTRKKAAEVLMNRILENSKLDKRIQIGNMNFDPALSAEETNSAKKQAQEQARSMSLNVVRLSFEVFLPDNLGQFTRRLAPVVSQPIYDSKSPGASALKICRMDKYGGCCTGNEEVFLLCEKVQKEDIAVRFVEHNEDGSVKWEAYGNFSPLDVHRQYAIVFKTPAYYNANIDKAVNVMIMLQRKTDCEVSEAKAFTYYPQNRDKDLIARKKRKKLPLDSTFNYSYGDGPGGGAPGGGGMGGGGFGPGGPGPGGGMGGGGGGPNQFSVMLPNGNIVDQMSMLPTTVEQVVKEEFARSHAESPDYTSTSDESSQSPMASPYDPMLWDNNIFSADFADLETDAAHSLQPPHVVRTGSNLRTRKQNHFSVDPSSLKPATSQASKLVKKGDRKKSTKMSSGSDKKEASDELTSSSSLDVVDGLIPSPPLDEPDSTQETEKVQTNIEQEAGLASPGTSAASAKAKVTLKIVAAQSDEDPGIGRDGGSDVVSSPTTTVSEGMKTDEGFSEVSEEVSVKEEVTLKNTEAQEKVAPIKAEVKGEGLTKPMKAATAVVKRIMDRLTARTVRALQDYSETSDVRYLLLVQRHLTAVKNENGDLPIHLSIINNQTYALQQLLDVMVTLPNPRTTINAYNYVRQTALHLAAIMQQPYHIELLLHAGADPAMADRNGNTPAHLAVMNNSLEALQALVKYLRPGVTAAKPFPELNYLNYDGYTPVHLAAQSSNVDMLRLLVHGRANVDVPDGKSGRTALHHAVELDDLPVAGYLLMEANADVNARCFDGNTPLHIACCRGLVGMVALLMTAGANPEVENEEVPPEEDGDVDETEDGPRQFRRGLQPIDYAAGNERIVRVLKGDQSTGEERIRDPMDDLEEDSSVKDADGKTCMQSTCDSGLSSIGIHPGDMDQLSYESRVELSVLLDPVHTGKDIFALADRLGYNNLVTALGVMGCSGTSPTRFLLDYHETADGTVGKLRECLRLMGRDDAVQLIDRAAKSGVKTKPEFQHCQVDSGVISCN
ncbi:hypothetical protein BaRGS_00010244 [Batillaria attramentaria]|uniref:RHD domain-containing protein n=1 Tax=Batillaria attramentaria TaxID=370345 RepID=A0ABD0LG58_9CAEN